MYKVANQIIDIYDDVELAGIQKLASLNPNINVLSPEERNQLSDHDFALCMITKKAHKLNKFPIESHDNTWLSNQYFNMNHHKLAHDAKEIAAYHIKKACQRFNIEPTPSVTGLAKEASSNVYYEEAAPLQASFSTRSCSLDDMSEAEKIASNYSFAQYAFATPEHVKMGCMYFEKQAEKMPVETRHGYAAALQKRAHELGMGQQRGHVAKYASDHYSPLVDAHLRSRASLVEVADPKFSAALTKLAAMKQQLTPIEFAKVLHGFDKRANLDRHYGGYLTDPYQATFAQEPDQYAGYRQKVAGRQMDGAAIKRIVHEKEAKIKDYFGQTMVEELKKDPVPIFDSLPMDAKEIIVGIADGHM